MSASLDLKVTQEPTAFNGGVTKSQERTGLMSLEVDLRHVGHPLIWGLGGNAGANGERALNGSKPVRCPGKLEPWGRHSLRPAKVRGAL